MALTEMIPCKYVSLVLLLMLAIVTISNSAIAASRRVEVHLYGGDTAKGAPLAAWYRSIGITDVWLPYGKGAFPQDTANDGYLPTAQTPEDMEAVGTLASYRKNHVRYWWFERPVPDFLYAISKRADFPKTHLWDSTAETDAVWDNICNRIKSIYPSVRKAGFSGLIYDSEAYYSYQGDESGKEKPWIWGGHSDQYGLTGNYYKRGLQVGKAISSVWPKAKVIIAYAFGYKGENWFYRGIKDGGTNFYIGPEHTYGAGPVEKDLGEAWYQSWWRGRKLKATCDWKRTQFPFIKDNQQVNAGLFPIDFGAKKPNYRAKYFREQLEQAANSDPKGPIPVWIWPQGPFSQEAFESVKYAPGESAQDYLKALKAYSKAFGK